MGLAYRESNRCCSLSDGTDKLTRLTPWLKVANSLPSRLSDRERLNWIPVLDDQIREMLMYAWGIRRVCVRTKKNGQLDQNF